MKKHFNAPTHSSDMDHGKPHPAFKVWLETEDGYVFGPGVYSLLKKVGEVGTLKEASTSLDMSYRYAWGLIRKAEEKLGEPLLSAHKGGKAGGGGAELTDRGKRFLVEFEGLMEQMRRVSMSASSGFSTGVVKDVGSGREPEVTISIASGETIHLKKGDRLILAKLEY